MNLQQCISIVLDVISWTAAVSACQKGGQWQQASSLVRNRLWQPIGEMSGRPGKAIIVEDDSRDSHRILGDFLEG